MLPENHPTDPWKLDFFVNPPESSPAWIKVQVIIIIAIRMDTWRMPRAYLHGMNAEASFELTVVYFLKLYN
jgi:hypothetical protein